MYLPIILLYRVIRIGDPETYGLAQFLEEKLEHPLGTAVDDRRQRAQRLEISCPVVEWVRVFQTCADEGEERSNGLLRGMWLRDDGSGLSQEGIQQLKHRRRCPGGELGATIDYVCETAEESGWLDGSFV